MPSRSERRVALGLLSPSGVRLFSRVRLFSPSKGNIVVTGLGVLVGVGDAAGGNTRTSSGLAGDEAGGVGVEAGATNGVGSAMKRGEGAILSSTVGTVGDESVMMGVVLSALCMLSSSSFSFSFSFSFSRSFSLSLSFSFSRSFSARAASRSGRIRSAIEVFFTFPSGAPSLLVPRPARTFLKAKKSPNFFFMFFVGAVEGVEVVKVVV